jgi:DNA-binding NarL/FixJ family response regulator
MNASPIRTAVADDQGVVRAGIARILAPADGFDVVAQCADGEELLAAVAAMPVDLVVTDVRMPCVNGIQATRRLRAGPTAPPVLVLTTFDEDEVLWGVLEAGAAGFVLKDAGAEELITAARTVAAGGAWFDPAVTGRLLAAYRRTVAPAQRSARRLEQLTAREHEVLRCLARGKTNAEIAAGLYVSEATVKSHVGSIFTKLEVRDRAAAIVYAFDHGFVEPGSPSP